MRMGGIGVIVLAAGRSTRFAGPEPSKLLALVGGVPLVRVAVLAAVNARIGDVVVVTGARAGDVVEAVAGLPITVVHASRFADGMAHSLRRGIEAMRETEAAMIALGDQPGLRPEAYRRVADRWRKTGASIVVPRYADNDAPSHPVLFAAQLYPELLMLDGDVGARSVIARDPSRVIEEPVEWPAPCDVDTVADLDALAARPSADVELRGAVHQPSNTSEPPR